MATSLGSYGQFRHLRQRMSEIEKELIERGLDPETCSEAEFMEARAVVAARRAASQPPVFFGQTAATGQLNKS